MPDKNFNFNHHLIPGKKPFSLLSKPYGPVCNLDCVYCYYLEKSNLYEEKKDKLSQFRMTDTLLEKYIHDYIEAVPGKEVEFSWQGGEPTLLGIDFFRKAVVYQKKYGEGRVISNAFQTNGTLVTEEWAAFFAWNNFLIGLSIDGPSDLNDRYRKTASGSGSFSAIMESVKLFHKHGVEFNTLTAITNRNSKWPLKVYHFLKDIGSRYMQFIPVVEREAVDTGLGLRLVANDYMGDARVTEESVDPLNWGRFLTKIFDEWVRMDVGKVFVNYFDNTLAPYAGEEPSLCTMRSVCGDGLVMEHNGDVYACDHFVYPRFYLGNITGKKMEDMAQSDAQLKFGLDKRNTLPMECRKCMFLQMCGGDCPKHRFVEIDDGEKISYLHEGYLHYFKHVDTYMRIMADLLNQKQAPANIMKMFPEKERRRIAQRTKYRL